MRTTHVQHKLYSSHGRACLWDDRLHLQIFDIKKDSIRHSESSRPNAIQKFWNLCWTVTAKKYPWLYLLKPTTSSLNAVSTEREYKDSLSRMRTTASRPMRKWDKDICANGPTKHIFLKRAAMKMCKIFRHYFTLVLVTVTYNSYVYIFICPKISLRHLIKMI